MDIRRPPVYGFANISQSTESPSSRQFLKRATQAVNDIFNLKNENETPILGEYNESLCLVVSYDHSNNKLCIRTDKGDKLTMVNAKDVTFIRAITADNPIPVDRDKSIEGTGIPDRNQTIGNKTIRFPNGIVLKPIDEKALSFLIGMDFKTSTYKVEINSQKIIWLKESDFKINTELQYIKKHSLMTNHQTFHYCNWILKLADGIEKFNEWDLARNIVSGSDNGWKIMGFEGGPIYFKGSENAELKEIRDVIVDNVRDYTQQRIIMFVVTAHACMEYIDQPLKEGDQFRQKKQKTLEKMADILKNLGVNSDKVDRQIDKIKIDSNEPPFGEVFAKITRIYDQLINPKQPIINAKSR